MLLLLAWYAWQENAPAVVVESSPSIAVLPFQNYSQQHFLADGLRDDIISHLSYVPGLRVMSGLSSQQYRNSNKTARQIGEELRIAYLLKGSVQLEGDQVKVNVQLIHAPSNAQQWGTSMTRPFRELFAIQRDLAREITSTLRITLNPAEKRRLEQLPTAHPQAYEAFLQGRYHLYQSPPQSLYTALAHFERAATLDSNFTGAHEYTAHTLVELSSGWAISPLRMPIPR